MIKTLLLIGVGGSLGSITRYLVTLGMNKWFSSPFPYGTFAANILGCLLIGLIYGCSERFQWLSLEWRIFLTTGFCGGFTTFSSFAYENIRLAQNGDYVSFFFYIALSVALGLSAVLLGINVCKLGLNN